MVGKNEAGKTALLRALYRLNPIIPEEGNFDVTDDYPRADVEDYQQDVESGDREPAKVIEATFTLSDEEICGIETEFGKGILSDSFLTLSKGYDNKLFVSLSTNPKKAIKSIIDQAQIPTSSSLDNLVKLADENNSSEYSEHINRLKSIIQNINAKNGLIIYIYDKYLAGSLPKFLLFEEFYLMKGCENIEVLKTRVTQNKLEKSDYPLLGLIELARLNLDELLNHKRTEELVNKLEGASNHLSKKVLKYWSQNKHINIKFDVRPARPGDPEGMRQGTNIWGRVHDSKREVSTLLGTRSRGFVWFFSFLAWFDQQQKNNQPLILLLDEPGLFLHGRAQADLLDFMEKELKPNHQVIYTTHSPFMVDPSKLDRVLIVQDRSMDEDKTSPNEDGTKVINNIDDATEDSLFPLQGALGYDICQSLFIGPNCLIVEGVSDLLYLQSISSLLESKNMEKIDDRWTITPVGGADKIPTFVALLGAQKKIKIVTLIDIQNKDKQKIDNLFEKKLLKKQNVLTFADFVNSKEADIEDMFGENLYLKLVNEEYSRELSTPILAKNLNSKLPRIIMRLDNYFSKKPLTDNHKFNHYRPARYFAENITKLADDIPTDIINKFEEVFKTINRLLK